MQLELFSALPEQFTIYAARHGKPESRPDIRYDIPPGPVLSQHGREEAAELGGFLREHAPQLAWMQVSPLERTLGTAQIAGELCGLEYEINHDLAEWREDESEEQLRKRVERAFRAAAERSAALAAPVAVVTHGGPILAMLKNLGFSKAQVAQILIYDRNPISTAGAWRFERTDGHVRAEMVFVPNGHAMPPAGARSYLLPIAEEKPAQR